MAVIVGKLLFKSEYQGAREQFGGPLANQTFLPSHVPSVCTCGESSEPPAACQYQFWRINPYVSFCLMVKNHAFFARQIFGLVHIRGLAFTLFWVPDDLSIQGETGSPVRLLHQSIPAQPPLL